MGQVADSVATEEDIVGSRSNGNGVVSVVNDTRLYQNVVAPMPKPSVLNGNDELLEYASITAFRMVILCPDSWKFAHSGLDDFQYSP